MARRRLALAVAGCTLLVTAVGCGEEAGVADDAEVTAYVDAPLCAGAERQLQSAGGRAGSVRVRVGCLMPVREGGRLDLAAVGVNARRATEDSSTVAYVEVPASPSFSRPIVESAGIAVIRSGSGEAAMERLLRVLGEANSDSVRDSVRESF